MAEVTARAKTDASTAVALLNMLLLAGVNKLVSLLRATQRFLKHAEMYAEAFLESDQEKAFGQMDADMQFMRAVQVIGGAIIGIAIVALVANEVLTVDAINNSSGPFSGVSDQLGTTGMAAVSLLIVGLVVLAANRIMGFFGGGGF